MLGNPLNRLAPDLPGHMLTSDLSIIRVVLTLRANSASPGNSIGQKAADGHLDTNDVPAALVVCACCNTHGTKYTGGTTGYSIPANRK